jgi:hypothetical protein
MASGSSGSDSVTHNQSDSDANDQLHSDANDQLHSVTDNQSESGTDDQLRAISSAAALARDAPTITIVQSGQPPRSDAFLTTIDLKESLPWIPSDEIAPTSSFQPSWPCIPSAVLEVTASFNESRVLLLSDAMTATTNFGGPTAIFVESVRLPTLNTSPPPGSEASVTYYSLLSASQSLTFFSSYAPTEVRPWRAKIHPLPGRRYVDPALEWRPMRKRNTRHMSYIRVYDISEYQLQKRLLMAIGQWEQITEHWNQNTNIREIVWRVLQEPMREA